MTAVGGLAVFRLQTRIAEYEIGHFHRRLRGGGGGGDGARRVSDRVADNVAGPRFVRQMHTRYIRTRRVNAERSKNFKFFPIVLVKRPSFRRIIPRKTDDGGREEKM